LANLSAADLTGANLSEADLSAANLSAANLSAANLTGADLSEAHTLGEVIRWIQTDHLRLIDWPAARGDGPVTGADTAAFRKRCWPPLTR
jgi:uncharacterized protein YjbI with pentapeptide repeats